LAILAKVAMIYARMCAYARWVASAWIVWGTGLVVVAALTIALWLPIYWPRMYLTGLALQLGGICLGIPALIKTRKLFGLPSFADSVREWQKRRPQRSHIIMPLTGVAMTASLGAVKLSLWSAMDPGLDTAKRIDALVANVERLRAEISESNAAHVVSIANLRSDMEARIRDTHIKLSDESRKLLESQTGGLAFARVALVLIFVGTVLAGIASDIGALWVS
jgi:hypothetical protein